MHPSYYPIALDLAGKRCLVVGGGAIATDKVAGLLRARADVTVIAPHATDWLEERAAEGRIALHRRPYRPDDLDGIYLAYGATDDPAVNEAITERARSAGILVNAVDDIPNCDFFAMAIARRGDLQIAISTDGQSPAFSRWVREYLDAWLPTEFGDLLAILGDVRKQLRAEGPVPPYEHWQEAITDEVLLRLRHGDRAGAHRQVLTTLREAAAEEQLVPAGAGRSAWP
jgi:precorrin-2 dehydrogenase/sirohydrochlorin ferrochelatase